GMSQKLKVCRLHQRQTLNDYCQLVRQSSQWGRHNRLLTSLKVIVFRHYRPESNDRAKATIILWPLLPQGALVERPRSGNVSIQVAGQPGIYYLWLRQLPAASNDIGSTLGDLPD